MKTPQFALVGFSIRLISDRLDEGVGNGDSRPSAPSALGIFKVTD